MNLSRSNVEDENDSDTSSSSTEPEEASSKTDAEEPTKAPLTRPARLRRTQSLDDLSRHTEQASTVRAAERNLTAEQCEILAKRQDKITREQTQNRPETPNATPGPSSYIAKGKFVDRNQEVDDSELDIEAQHAALKNWNQVRDEIQESLDGDQDRSETDNDGFTGSREASRKSKTSQAKKTIGKTGRYDSLEVEETSDENPEDPELAEHQKKANKSKKRTSKKKNVHNLEPLASAFDRRIAEVVRGKSRAPSSSHHESRHGSTRPMDQLPADSFLADALQVALLMQSHRALNRPLVMSQTQILTIHTLHHQTVIPLRMTPVPQAPVVARHPHQTQILRTHLTTGIITVATTKGMDLDDDIAIAIEGINMVGSESSGRFLQLRMMELLMARSFTDSQWK
ncbi:hypothetical protein F5146DRAFT_1036161 [Armillaria mellea]|nr:hypothetical protein F5146DRAFT_1036161 [Armillaria mellea]